LKWLDENLNPEEGLQHTLFYVGDEIFEDTVSLLSRDKNMVASPFYGQTSNTERKEILDQFGDGVIKCLVAMKCLDEGVDVPATRTAYFLASSGNPKEFVQRRGRVLRKSEETGKKEAELFDLISIPPSFVDKEHEHYNASRSLLISEFKRIREFAGLAKNKYGSLDQLKEVIARFNLYDQID
jgi:superfamily II DNA or RNA helicase